LAAYQRLPLYPDEQTSLPSDGMSQKWPAGDFSAFAFDQVDHFVELAACWSIPIEITLPEVAPKRCGEKNSELGLKVAIQHFGTVSDTASNSDGGLVQACQRHRQ
jgi:hypothetical protein